MSEEIFMEVEDDIRQQQLNQFWEENKYWIIGGVISAIILTGSLSFWRHWEYKRDAAATTQLTKLVMNDSIDIPKMSKFIEDTNKNHATIARFLLAANHTKKKKNAEAITVYEEIIATQGIDKNYNSLAKLLTISLQIDNKSADLVQLNKDLSELAVATSPWKYTAKEFQALIYAKQKDFVKAIAALETIANDINAPEDARTRATDIKALYSAEKNQG